MSKDIYLAAPLFTVWERHRNLIVANELDKAGYGVLLPQSIEAPQIKNGLDMSVVFKECVRLLDESDGMVALVDGSDVDSGVAWELGYAYAKRIPSLCVRTDMRAAEQGEPTNVMISYGANRMVCPTGYHTSVEQVMGTVVLGMGELFK